MQESLHARESSEASNPVLEGLPLGLQEELGYPAGGEPITVEQAVRQYMELQTLKEGGDRNASDLLANLSKEGEQFLQDRMAEQHASESHEQVLSQESTGEYAPEEIEAARKSLGERLLDNPDAPWRLILGEWNEIKNQPSDEYNWTGQDLTRRRALGEKEKAILEHLSAQG